MLNLQLPRPVVSVEYLNPFGYKDFETDKIGLCRRGTDKRGRDRQKRTQLNSLVCPPVSHNAIRAMNLATLVTYSLNRYSLQASSAPKRKNLGSLSIQARLSDYNVCMTSAAPNAGDDRGENSTQVRAKDRVLRDHRFVLINYWLVSPTPSSATRPN